MILSDSLLVSLIQMMDRIPMPPSPPQRARGRAVTYPDRLLLTALAIRSIRRWYTAWAWLRFLDQAEPLVPQLRGWLSDHGRFPSRRTWERRLPRWPRTRPALLGCLGRSLGQVLNPWAEQGQGAALDSPPWRAHGGVWHQKEREQGVVPHPRIDIEAAWSKSGYHGWWYGWNLHLAVTIGRGWIPLAAELTPANEADNVIAPRWLTELPLAVRYGLGDQHYNTPALRAECARHHRELVATRRGAYPHTDGGVEGRRLFHKLRSQAIEPFHGLFKRLFEWNGQRPVKGLNRCQLLALGAVFLYQLVLLYQHEHGVLVGIDIKPLLRAA